MKLIKEIHSKTGELHFRRWQLFKTPWFTVYLHHILRSDMDKHLHSHPWYYVSVILSGGYREQRIDKEGNISFRIYSRGSILKRTHKMYHKIKLIKPVWSLVFVGSKRYPWGYLVNDSFVEHEKYRELKNAISPT